MRIKISRSQWEEMGRKGGWMRTSQEYTYDTLPSSGPRDTSIPPKKMPESIKSAPKKEWDIYNQPPAKFMYFINLDERGSFYADVRNTSGNTVFEIKAGNELGPDESSIFEDGYMKNKYDLEGLKEYLVELGIMKPNQKLVRGN